MIKPLIRPLIEPLVTGLIKHKRSNKSAGFTLPELVFTVIVLGSVLTYTLTIYFQTLTANANTAQYNNVLALLDKKMTQIESLGFWIWEGNSSTSYQDTHPMEIWKTSLSDDGFSGTSTMDVVFLKKQGSNYVPFSGDDFDGNEPRNRVEVTLTLSLPSGGTASQNMTLIISKNSERHCWAQLYIMKQALLMYEEDNGSYPSTSTWATDLVPDYIPEIPNNPYTKESNKTTHIEDAVDWHYQNVSNTVTLAAQSHLSTISITF